MSDYADRIWKTKKIRINTESRLLENSIIYEIIIPLYSLFFILLVILPGGEDSNCIKIFSIAGSLIILIASIIASNQNYQLRAYKMKQHYIMLDKLYIKIVNTNDENKKEKIFYKYLKELENVENHIDYDYKKTIISLRKDKNCTFPKPTFSEMILFYMIIIKRWSIIVFFLGIPVIISAIIIL